MNTPICDFVSAYAADERLRLHMPGHKGRGLLGVEARDITEIDGADVLYHATGIIRESEQNAAALFSAARTVYSVEGSTLCIRAMLYLAMQQALSKGKTPRILAARNAHRAFMTAAALLDVDVTWLYPETAASHLACDISLKNLARRLLEEQPTALYVTSPDYLGNMVDVAALAQVCHQHDVLLLVDNAHGAYLRFLPESRHPLTLGADMCCDSAHKTLAVLTGGAYLHVAKTAPAALAQAADRAMTLFASTSPSYLILQSLDAMNAELADGYPQKLAAFLPRAAALKAQLQAAGYTLVGEEPLKLTVAPKTRGYTGTDLAACLLRAGVVCEFADPDYLVMMLSVDMTEEECAHLVATLSALPQRDVIHSVPPPIPRPRRVLSPRAAMMAPAVTRDVRHCEGAVLASAAITCPPAIPLVVCGEEIDQAAIEGFLYYGITDCDIVK